MIDHTPPNDGRTVLLRDEATVAGRFLLILAAIAALVWMVLQVKVVTIGAFLGLALAALLWPAVSFLRRWIPQFLAVILSVLLFLAIVGVTLGFLVNELVNQLPELSEAAVAGVQDLIEWFKGFGPGIPAGIEEQLTSWLGSMVSGAGNVAAAGVEAVSTLVTVTIVVLFVMLFALLGGDDLASAGVRMLPARWRHSATATVRSLARTARAWLGAAVVTGIVSGVLIGIGMWILGVPLAVPIGMVTFFAGFIPTIGPILAGAVATAVAFTSGGLTTALWCVLVVLIVQQVQGNVLEPLLLSRAMDFHPLITFLLVTTGGIAFGFIGLFLAVPIVGLIWAGVGAWRNPDGRKTEKADEPDPAPATT